MRNESRLNIYINNEQGRKALGELADQYQKTTAALEALTKAGKGNGEEAEQLKQKQAEQLSGMKAMQSQIGLTSQSYSELKARYSATYKEWSKSIPGSSEREKLKNELTDIKGALDQNALSAKGAQGAFAQLSTGLGSSIPGFSALTGGIGAATRASLAFIATPIGAVLAGIVLVVTSLKEAFSRSVAGQEKWNKIMGVLNGIITVAMDLLSDLGEALIWVFENPLKAYDTFKKYTLDPLVNYIEVITNGARGCAYAIAGIFSEEARVKSDQYFSAAGQNIKNLKTTALDLYGGIKDSFTAISEKVVETGQKLVSNAKAGAAIGQMENELARKRREEKVHLAQLEKTANENKLKSTEADKYSYKEREAFLQRAIAAELERMDILQKQKILEAQIQIEKNNLGKTNMEDAQAAADLQAEILLIESESLTRRKKVTGQLVTFRVAAAKQITDAENQAIAERDKAAQDAADKDEKTRSDESKNAEKTLIAQNKATLLSYKKMYADGQIAQKEYEAKVESENQLHLNRLIESRKSYGQDVEALEIQRAEAQEALLDKQLDATIAATQRAEKESNEAAAKAQEERTKAQGEADQYMNSLFEDSAAARLKSEIAGAKAALEKISEMRAAGLISDTEAGFAYAQQALSQAQNLLNQITAERQKALDQQYEIEMGGLTEQYNEQMSAAQGNEEEQQRIREQYASKKEQLEYQTAVKKLEVEKQAADAQLAINIGQAVAGAALAVIQCWGQLGPIGGGIMAAILAPITALQIKSMVQQRDAIKAKTIEAPSGGGSTGPVSSAPVSAPPSVSTTARTIIPDTSDTPIAHGYDQGGFTEVERAGDARRFHARNRGTQRGYIEGTSLLVSEGGTEFVASAAAVRNPRIRPVFDAIDTAQRAGTVHLLDMSVVGSALHPRSVRGYAQGGYTDDTTAAPGVTVSAAALEDIRVLMREILARMPEDTVSASPLRAYVVLDEFEAKQRALQETKQKASRP